MDLEETQIRYKITQLTDNDITVALSLVEDVELESISQQQMMLEAVDRAITDTEVRQQLKPILEAILKAQPQTVIKSYPQTLIQVTMPKSRYERIGYPKVGDRLLIDLKNENPNTTSSI
ncbi:MAG TPA: hypothetical protein VK462_02945 [Nitrososphaeraceae archaeon]|nr:hypothetical protein [Nitrososphaeraceae archaeon]